MTNTLNNTLFVDGNPATQDMTKFFTDLFFNLLNGITFFFQNVGNFIFNNENPIISGTFNFIFAISVVIGVFAFLYFRYAKQISRGIMIASLIGYFVINGVIAVTFLTTANQITTALASTPNLILPALGGLFTVALLYGFGLYKFEQVYPMIKVAKAIGTGSELN
jgi:hypothetical protein